MTLSPLSYKLPSLSNPMSFSSPISKLPKLGSFLPVFAPSSSGRSESISSSLFSLLMCLTSDEDMV